MLPNGILQVWFPNWTTSEGWGRFCTSCYLTLCLLLGLPRWRSVKSPPANAGDAGDSGLILVCGRSPGGGNGNPLQYSSLGNPMHRGAW